MKKHSQIRCSLDYEFELARRLSLLSQSTIEHLKHFRSPSPSLVNDLIRAFSTGGLPEHALLVFGLIRKKGFKPDKCTYPFLFKATASLGVTNEGKVIHGDAIKHGLVGNVYVDNSLVYFYGCCAEIAAARKVFDEMRHRTVVSWNSIIGAYVDNSRFQDATGVFTKMWISGVPPDETTFVALLSACSQLGNTTLGKWVHCKVIVKGLAVNCHLGTALVDMYAKCGNLGYAHLLFDRIPDKNTWSWSAMIVALAHHGFSREALSLFTQMQDKSIQPNCVTFLGVLCACSHSGLVKQGYKYFNEMIHLHKIKPMLAHYGVMVDMLGRAGELNRAYSFILNMDIEPDAVIWRTLFAACNFYRSDDRDGIGKKVGEKLLQLEPDRSGNMVMISKKYAEFGMWEKAEMVRNSRTKFAGESCIEIGGIIHRFISGDDKCVGNERLYHLLEVLSCHMNKPILEMQV